jgi:hypothetical protein
MDAPGHMFADHCLRLHLGFVREEGSQDDVGIYNHWPYSNSWRDAWYSSAADTPLSRSVCDKLIICR